jgi:hypothetical protein
VANAANGQMAGGLTKLNAQARFCHDPRAFLKLIAAEPSMLHDVARGTSVAIKN